MTFPEWGNLYNLMKQITSTMISSTIYYKPYYFHAGFCGKKKKEKNPASFLVFFLLAILV